MPESNGLNLIRTHLEAINNVLRENGIHCVAAFYDPATSERIFAVQCDAVTLDGMMNNLFSVAQETTST